MSCNYLCQSRVGIGCINDKCTTDLQLSYIPLRGTIGTIKKFLEICVSIDWNYAVSFALVNFTCYKILTSFFHFEWQLELHKKELLHAGMSTRSSDRLE